MDKVGKSFVVIELAIRRMKIKAYTQAAVKWCVALTLVECCVCALHFRFDSSKRLQFEISFNYLDGKKAAIRIKALLWQGVTRMTDKNDSLCRCVPSGEIDNS